MYVSYVKNRKRKRKCKKYFGVIPVLLLTGSLCFRETGRLLPEKGELIKNICKETAGIMNAGLSVKEGKQEGIWQNCAGFLLPAAVWYEENKKAYETDVESELSYEIILAREARDENYIDENGQVVITEGQNDIEEVQTEEGMHAGEKTEEEADTETVKAQTIQENQNVVPQERKKSVEYSMDKLADFDYLVQNFYQVDSTTTIKSDQLNVEALTGRNMKISHDPSSPQILIYHTHSNEGYADSIAGDASTTVVGVGDYLTILLTEQYGYNVIHDRGEYDAVRDKAYKEAAPALETILSDHPEIDVIIDLHRDGVGENTRLVTTVDGVPMAKVMFFNGLSRTSALGDISYLPNPYIADNLAFSFQMQLTAAEYYPGYTRKIYLKGYRFNMHYRPKSLLVEVGAQTNTLQEALNAMVPLADVLNKVLKE